MHGVEIQEPLVKVARERLQAFKSATVHHLGWSNSMQKGVRVAALGGYGGLYSTEQLAAAKRDNGRPHILSAMASSAMQKEVVNGIEGGQTDTMPISVWARDTLALSRLEIRTHTHTHTHTYTHPRLTLRLFCFHMHAEGMTRCCSCVCVCVCVYG